MAQQCGTRRQRDGSAMVTGTTAESSTPALSKKEGRHHLFIVNPRSFPLPRELDQIRAEITRDLEGLGETYTIHVSAYPREAIGVIRHYLEGVPSTVIVRIYAVGGDGILFDCLNGMVGVPNAELAAIPHGGSNDFVRAFGEGMEPLFKNIAKQAIAPTIPTDIFTCKDRYALLNFAAIGIESQVYHNYTNMAQWSGEGLRVSPLLTSLYYSISSVLVMFNRRVCNQYYEIILDDNEVIKGNGSINLANGPCYAGDKAPNYRAVPDDTLMDFLFLRESGLLADLSLIPSYIKGKAYEDTKHFIYRKVKKVEIKSNRHLLVVIDGETFSDTEVTFEVVPHAIQFVTPDGVDFKRGVPRS
ncbi:MAG: hypothetical protein LBS98_06745 [Coriobacteriales bacterium]|nr:hypothetical protein [Coriobacteriales bacterium]